MRVTSVERDSPQLTLLQCTHTVMHVSRCPWNIYSGWAQCGDGAWGSMNREPSALYPMSEQMATLPSLSSIIHHSFSQAVHRCLGVYLCVFVHSLHLGEVTLRRLAVKQVYALRNSRGIFRVSCVFRLKCYHEHCTASLIYAWVQKSQQIFLIEEGGYPTCLAKRRRKEAYW